MLPLLAVMYIKALKIHFNCAEWIWSITLELFVLISIWKEDYSVCKLIELISCPPIVIHMTEFGSISIGNKSFMACVQNHIFAAYMQRGNWGYLHILSKCPEFICSPPKYQIIRAFVWEKSQSLKGGIVIAVQFWSWSSKRIIFCHIAHTSPIHDETLSLLLTDTEEDNLCPSLRKRGKKIYPNKAT